jgi:hypothetical protein
VPTPLGDGRAQDETTGAQVFLVPYHPARGQLVTDGKEYHSIMVTDGNDMIVVFGNSSVTYFCLTELSHKLRRVLIFEPGNGLTTVAVAEAQWRFDQEIAFWKEYLGVSE